MYLVENKSEIIKTMKLMDRYIKQGSQKEKEFVLNRIKKGICFVAYKEENSYRFYPSRFIGYLDNNMDAHLNNDTKSGIDTNGAISEIIGNKPECSLELDELYKKYCEELGFTANDKGAFGVERKYWLLD